jgi:DNA-binding CsgD family transcriptional regulator/PAS domain-containing protein
MRSALSAHVFSDLVGSIYDCALDPGRWPETLTRLHTELDFAGASMSMIDLVTGEVPLMIMVGPEPAWIERAPSYASDIVDLWGGWERMRALSTAEPAVQSRVTDLSKWDTNRHVVEWARPQGLSDTLIIVLANDPTALGSVGFGRHESMGEIGDFEIDAASLLLPHLQRAVAIGRLLDIKSVVATTFDLTLDTLAVAVALVDADLRIVHANAAARALLAADGAIRSRRGTLRVRPAAVEAALRVAVGDAAENEAATGRRGFGIPATGVDDVPHALHVLPLRQGALRPGLMPSAVAAVFIAPVIAAAPSPAEILAALYDLSPAEARVFGSIASGLTRAEAADALGVEPTTVKAHLARIFAKTATRRQADLVALAAAIALPLRA